MATLIVSPSPHVHSGDSVSKNMYNVVIALLPAYLVSLYFFGLGALVVSLVSMVSCVLFEYLIQRFVFKGKTTVWNGSALLTGMLLSFNLPSNLPWWMVVIGAFVAIGIGKMTFGGLGNNIFNPALVGRVFLLVSFPAAMTTWPVPTPFSLHYTDAETGATVLAMLKGGFGELPSHIDMMVGNMGGSLGEVSAVALIIGGIYLMIRKVITWHIPVSILLTVAVFTGILHACNPAEFASPLVHLLSGGLMLGAFFMATDYVTSPMTHRGQLIFGFGIGVITVVIRTWGAYPEGVSFAILIMNAVTPLINTYVKPRRFGEKVKK
ncbi:MAG: RnfABCDGE type electron transport complex subunit D [bacterium]|uniref:Ion-translocating oxidoreductase complex subunit D n=1 Tax=Candidatus Aphodosoma intestinipullorum TaxID=2840674 RepID=A0A940DJJ8_9BACT|nr:RnfABCDGE type electron transport complex subunit D [Candidatus Aphodosoma intestinipullorum]